MSLPAVSRMNCVRATCAAAIQIQHSRKSKCGVCSVFTLTGGPTGFGTYLRPLPSCLPRQYAFSQLCFSVCTAGAPLAHTLVAGAGLTALLTSLVCCCLCSRPAQAGTLTGQGHTGRGLECI